ncbi:hypothetical protein OGAPHI_003670 [Ogataea philodendri]|uniref:Uncharacterized protein n=1 Tax=Ogataea philodendri TaxID=1378263 RepID=A0A9P8P5M5_9ASCO|nr:uncharacterized protein OGAPHI_003670 [Ogataea philodendri]KAH3665485.1 hypothetical protein OGAPHI_003670 [Ogataea philodendri]
MFCRFRIGSSLIWGQAPYPNLYTPIRSIVSCLDVHLHDQPFTGFGSFTSLNLSGSSGITSLNSCNSPGLVRTTSAFMFLTPLNSSPPRLDSPRSGVVTWSSAWFKTSSRSRFSSFFWLSEDLNMLLAPNFKISLNSPDVGSVFVLDLLLSVIPREIMAYSKIIFRLARSRTCSSTVSLETNLYTITWFFCPIRCALAIACKSACGFQSESKIITVSAVIRLIPKPPALVDSKKTKSLDPSALK